MRITVKHSCNKKRRSCSSRAKNALLPASLFLLTFGFAAANARGQAWTPPPDNASQPAGDPFKLPEVAKMPDVVGVRLGMSPQDALLVLHKQYPADRYQEMKVTWWPAAQKPDYGFNVLMPDPLATPDVYLSFTAPPARQVVWRVVRYGHKLHVNHATLLAALRQKYGKESFAAMENGTPTNDDQAIGHLIWLFDEHGARAAMPPVQTFANYGSIWQCVGRSNLLDGNSQMYLMSNPQPVMPKDDSDVHYGQNDWCASSFVGIHIALQPREIVETTATEMVDAPLASRTAHLSALWQRAGAEKAHQAEVEKSKQAKPVL